VRRDQRSEQRDRDQEQDDRRTNLGPPETERVAQDPELRAALKRRVRADGLDGRLEADVDGAHRAAVLSFGVTRIVARSAMRFIST
jgi:hypothetical protein